MKGTILVVDDDAVIRHLTRHRLECSGYDVADFDSGYDAMEAIEGGMKYDIGLFDMAVGMKDGNDLTQVSKTHNPGVPVIILSGYIMERPIGADFCIKKPCELGYVVEIIDRLLKQPSAAHQQ